MPRQYHIILSEEYVNQIIKTYKMFIEHHMCLDCYDEDDILYENIVKELEQAKQKPYTNFDKIKDEMTIDDVYDNENESLYDAFYDLANKNKNIFVHYSSLSECLESEVKG